MADILDTEPDFHSCIALALDSRDAQEQVKWLERALEIGPERAEDVLRAATGLENLSARTPGQAYIKKLEQLARKQARKKRTKK